MSQRMELITPPLGLRSPCKDLSNRSDQTSGDLGTDPIPCSLSMASDDDEWDPGMGTPERHAPFRTPPDEVVSPSKSSVDGSAPSTPRRGLTFGKERHQSFLKLGNMPGTPRSLLHQRRIMNEDDDDDGFSLHLPPSGSNTSRPRTAPSQLFGGGCMSPARSRPRHVRRGAHQTSGGVSVPRVANVNPFTPMPVRSKRPASPELGDDDRTIQHAKMQISPGDAGPAVGSGSFDAGGKDSDDDNVLHCRGRSSSIFLSTPPRGIQPQCEEPGSSVDPSSPKGVNVARMSRYTMEFEERKLLGKGEFGTVTLVKNKMDGTLYAIKRSTRRIAGLAEEQNLLREVYAHAVISSNPYILRYFSAWIEDDHMLIQNEYCDGGSLEDTIKQRNNSGSAFTEDEVLLVMKHVALGLRCLHAKHLAHLDIKPGNIFIKHEAGVEGEEDDDDDDDDSMASSPRSGGTDGVFEPAVNCALSNKNGSGAGTCATVISANAGGRTFGRSPSILEEEISEDTSPITDIPGPRNGKAPKKKRCFTRGTTFKIGDLGCVARTDAPDVDEGDSRYMAPELLNEYEPGRNLSKADIFSLGITVHELASCQPLPKSGEEWLRLRRGAARHLPRYSHRLNGLIERCLHPNPTERPSAKKLLMDLEIIIDRSVPAECKDSGQVLRENKALLRQSNLKDFEILNYKRQLAELNGYTGGNDGGAGPPAVMEIPDVQRGGGAATVDVEAGGTDGTATTVRYHPGPPHGQTTSAFPPLRSIPVGGGRGRRNSAPVHRMRSNSLW
eukprot:m.807408 g.807408  ORF g.807408 m.807408 type:complete len:780 (+) comp23378_c0_seq2:233-2572(+)